MNHLFAFVHRPNLREVVPPRNTSGLSALSRWNSSSWTLIVRRVSLIGLGSHELHGTNDVLSEDEVEYEDSEDVDFAERAGMTDEEFEEAFGNGGDEE